MLPVRMSRYTKENHVSVALVRKRSHHSLKNQHHKLKKTKKQSNSVIHITIRSINHPTPYNTNKSIEGNNHSFPNSSYHQDQLNKSSNIQYSVERLKGTSNFVNITPVNQQKLSYQNSWNNCDLNQQSDHSSRTNNDRVQKHRLRSSKVSDCKRTDKFINETDVTNDHHRNSKKNKTKICSPRCILILVIISLLLAAIVTIAVLIPVLITSKQTNVYPSTVPLLRWYRNGITIAGVTNVSGLASNLLNTPFDMAMDWSNTLYITDLGNNRVQKFLMGASNATTTGGQANGTGGTGLRNLRNLTGILVDDNANVYVSDQINSRVMFWSKGASSGVIIAGNGTSGTANNQLNYPYGLARDLNLNSLFIAEYYNYRVTEYLYNASSGIIVAGNNQQGINTTQLWYPHGIFFDSLSNSLLIANAGANNIVRWVLGDTHWTIAAGTINGSAGVTSVALNSATDVMLDPMGNIYVLDRYNHRVQFFLLDQVNATTIAGSTGKIGSNATLLNTPTSLTLDNQLNLYVVDRNNHRIQKFLRY